MAAGKGDQPCLLTPSETLTYASLQERVNRMANVLTRDLGLVTGNRVLLRGPNNAMMAAAWLAVIKAGGVTVATMPLLRARELAYPIGKAKIALALCDARLGEDLEKAKEQSTDLERIVYWGSDRADDLTRLMSQPGYEHFGAAENDVEFADGNVRIAKPGSNQVVSFGEMAKLCYMGRVSLSATGFYKTPKVHWDPVAMRGRPFFYFSFGAAMAEVAIDTLTGESCVLRADLVQDCGASLNPAIDLGT